ncbi:MAG: thioesterase family protein [Rhodococcus sp.]|uniref:thioesterase family protein n=1 Tax=Rhodococcus TaxID=1827 RepID=UPI0016ADFB4D|nr:MULTISPECIES: thioesterase family protein [Rhodococcus]NLV80754.1 thioesterase family protein [Rhodococcus sp. (in: high G+C Gram-positive bacteria)]
MTSEFCYRPVDAGTDDGHRVEYFSPSEHVLGPWGPIQHGGPVAGLLTRAMDRCAPRDGTRLTKISVDLLGPVPLADVRVSARVVRPGRRIEMLTADLATRHTDGSWRAAATATAWRLTTQATEDVVRRADRSLPLPEQAPALGDLELSAAWSMSGFVEAIEWRIADLGGVPGEPTVAWTNLSVPLVEGEPTSGLERVMAIADAANGIGARLDPAEFSFLNTELTVHLFEEPEGPWFGIAAEASVGRDGIGMNSAVLHAPEGPIGRIAQNLLVERRVAHSRV